MMRTGASDSELVQAAKSGNCDAFRTLVELYQGKVFGVALGVLRNPEDARDACQEAFLRAYRQLDRFEEEAAFYTWLYRIVVNACLDELRRRRRGSSEWVESLPASQPGPADRCAARELWSQVTDALARLSVEHRTVLVLRELEGLSYEEIAGVVGCPTGTVMSRLFHARRRMQKLLSVHRRAALAA